jgi:ribosomal protein L29
MKKNDVRALVDLSVAELSKKVTEFNKQLVKVLLEKKSGKLENTALPSRLRDDIARVKFVLEAKTEK